MTEGFNLPFEIVESKKTDKNKVSAGLKKVDLRKDQIKVKRNSL